MWPIGGELVTTITSPSCWGTHFLYHSNPSYGNLLPIIPWPRVCCKLRWLSVEVVYWCTGGGGRLWSGSRDVWRSAMKAKTDKTVFTCKLLLTAFCQIKSLSCKMKFILEEAALEKRMGWAKNWQFGGSDDCSRHNRGFCHQTFPNRRRISVAVYSRKEILKIGNKSWHKLWIVEWKWM